MFTLGKYTNSPSAAKRLSFKLKESAQKILPHIEILLTFNLHEYSSNLR